MGDVGWKMLPQMIPLTVKPVRFRASSSSWSTHVSARWSEIPSVPPTAGELDVGTWTDRRVW